MQQFNGFSQQGLNFLQQVRQENSKEWFDAHRGIYDTQLLTPFRVLVDELSATMLAIDPQFETRPAIGKTLSRIHRDTRFSHDKSRYRSRMWLTFKRPSKNWTDAPVYFCEIAPDAFRYGIGYYSATLATMELFRLRLRQQPQAFLQIAECCRPPFELVGESYKRPKVKEQAAEIATWYNRKSFAVMATDLQVEKLFDAELVALLRQGFLQLEPLYQFLMQIEAMKQVAPEDL